ncbi:hypothetical protein N0V93_006875 [Gnomoniopsis smithogilvyi]|uniref:trimethyllysine dioxygenase n=1 Tax=Gnomoniopsis smithogilvyi TaxID=1191159 RepID=A0A9W9CW47_9PEZI|nr:hypothetical protein N0V93_006875 [Gnomoniopsis smithogilvyi]
MLGSRFARLAARPRAGIIKSPQQIHSPPLSSSVISCVVYRRHASQLAGEVGGHVDAPMSGLSSPDAATGNVGSQGQSKAAGDITEEGINYRLDTKRWKYPSVGVRKGHSWETIPNIWLRDNCRCSKCVNKDTMQRNFSIFEIPSSVAPAEVKEETDGLRVVWDYEQHESFYTWDFLERYVDKGKRLDIDQSKRKLWGSEIAKDPPTVGYDEVMDTASESGLAKLTDHIMQYGLVFVDGTPFDDAIHTKRLLERIGPIRETHYGGFYDFVPDMAKADTAYTNIALPAHTDTTYFTDPAGLQAFHMLSHTPSPNAPEGESASGGESLLVDGFRAAELLRTINPEYFKSLCTFPLPWHASGNQGVTITPDELQPVIQLRPHSVNTSATDGSLLRIRWNNDDRGVPPLDEPIRGSGYKGLLKWYKAARRWNNILKKDSSEFWFQLKPGRTLIFDNYRVLHGRSAFTGMRRICGAYISRDDFISRWRNTNLSREEVLAQVIG